MHAQLISLIFFANSSIQTAEAVTNHSSQKSVNSL